MNTKHTESTVTIPTFNMGTFERKMKAFAKKAKKLGVKAPTWEEIGRTELPARICQEGCVDKVPAYIIKYTCEMPVLKGWQFVGTLNGFGDENIVASISEEHPIPERYRKMVGVCEHCTTKRTRKMTYVAYNEEEDRYISIGKSCLRDFFEIGNGPEEVANYAHFAGRIVEECSEWSDEDYDEFRSNAVRYNFVDLTDAIKLAYSFIKLKGFVSSTKAYHNGMTSTKEMMNNYELELGSKDFGYVDIYNYLKEQKDELEVEARKVIEFGVMMRGDNEYVKNVNAICRQKLATQKEIGIIAAVTAGYIREEEERKTADNSTSIHLGQIKDKIIRTVKLDSTKAINSFYGTTWIHNFTDTEGNVIVWFSSNEPKMEVGEEYTIKGTVKDHSEFQGIKQTIVTRVKDIAHFIK